jgi:DNA-binding transcriptional regulator YdaS (Cro superfamily)
MSLLDHIEFSDLRIFVTILRTGSFKAAAIQLGLTPSATSHEAAGRAALDPVAVPLQPRHLAHGGGQ